MRRSVRPQLSTILASSPLRHAQFRVFYVGSIGTALGYQVQATVAAWLMATLTPSALMVALVQTASTLPTLLLGLLAGALADIVSRRRIIVVTQFALATMTALLAIATASGVVGPVMLLVLTFLIGLGFTFYLPAQQASVNELVSRTELPRAVALGAVAFNVARALGPAIAGAIIAWQGSAGALFLAALFFAVMLAAVRALRASEAPPPAIPEQLMSGVTSGLRYARHTRALRALMARSIAFTLCASAFWALLPVIARDQFALGAGGFGLMSAGFGIGAVLGALVVPGQLRRRSLNAVVTFGALLWALSTLLLALTTISAVALAATFGCGVAWVSVLSSLSAGAQTSAPGWVRARVVALNLVAMQASLALGSVLWGAAASAFDTRAALLASIALLVLLQVLNRRYRVELGTEADATAGAQLPELTVAVTPRLDDGPVLIQIEYQIAPENRSAFLRAVHRIEPVRRRNGATSWRLFRDLAEDGRFIERFIVDSWGEYVRLRTRPTVSDQRLQDRVQELQAPGVAIRISRLIGVDAGREGLSAPHADGN